MKLIKKYKYKKFNRIDGEKRVYQTGKIKVPSVTTILKQTQSEEKTKSLEKWRKRVGKKEADKIRDDAGALGTALHKCLEKYILNKRDLKYFDKKSMIIMALEDTGSLGILTNVKGFSQKK